MDIKKVILVTRNLTTIAKNDAKDLSLINCELFHLDELQVNITHHMLVPKHSVLNEDQKHELMLKYRI